MEYELVYMTPTGDAMVLLRATVHPMLFPFMALKVGELSRFIPGLSLITLGHQVTELVFEHRNCRLRGEPARYFTGIEE